MDNSWMDKWEDEPLRDGWWWCFQDETSIRPGRLIAVYVEIEDNMFLTTGALTFESVGTLGLHDGDLSGKWLGPIEEPYTGGPIKDADVISFKEKVLERDGVWWLTPPEIERLMRKGEETMRYVDEMIDSGEFYPVLTESDLEELMQEDRDARVVISKLGASSDSMLTRAEIGQLRIEAEAAGDRLSQIIQSRKNALIKAGLEKDENPVDSAKN